MARRRTPTTGWENTASRRIRRAKRVADRRRRRRVRLRCRPARAAPRTALGSRPRSVALVRRRGRQQATRPERSSEREHGGFRRRSLGKQAASAQYRHDAFAEPIRLFEVRVAGENELAETKLVILDD